jgi:DNA adenine methylase
MLFGSIAKPFLKWAGGKTQLLTEIERILPKSIVQQKFNYIEPFVGSGAVLFWMLDKFENIDKIVINDINSDLINTYRIITNKPKELISILEILQGEYHSLEGNEEKKQEYYYQKRTLYNTRETDLVTQASLFIFLNRTCFNGLYRVNKNNAFNVPMGSYKKPTICDKENLQAVSQVLQKVEILNSDYKETLHYIKENTLFYVDPPYKPLNDASFNAYSKYDFNDNQQIELKEFCSKIDILGHHWILSNSDVKGHIENDTFFDNLYMDYQIERVKAKRMINSKGNKRGELNELLITNYKTIKQSIL